MNSRKSSVLAAIAVVGAILSAVTMASATPVIYNINRTIEAGSVTGFIETDGVMGVLTASDFIDWNLSLFDGSSTFNLTGPLSGNNSQVFVQGADTEEFETQFGNQLMFNFSGVDNGIFLFQQGLHYYCDASQGGPCFFPGETVVPISVAAGYQNNPNLRGVVVIGTEVGTTPEPSTCVLLLSGVSLAIHGRRHRIRERAVVSESSEA